MIIRHFSKTVPCFPFFVGYQLKVELKAAFEIPTPMIGSAKTKTKTKTKKEKMK
jgi:hypothetical protein